MFEKELAFFIDHQDELVRQYGGKTLLLQNATVMGAYDSPLAAYLEAQRQHLEPGTFMIQPCEPGPGAYTVTVNSAIR